MIDPEYRYWVPSRLVNDYQTNAKVHDWDQRRYYTIIGPTKYFPEEDDDLVISVLKRHIDELDKDVHTLKVDEEGTLVSTSSDPEQDDSLVFNFPSYMDCPSLQKCSTILSSSMTELDRLEPGVDLMSYVDELGHKKTVVYKWAMVIQRRIQMWSEIHFLQRLPSHPGLLALDRIVLDDQTNQILGFTTLYVPGSDLASSTRHDVFRLQHLKQLTEVVDLLNIELGIAHQDIAPRDLLLDSSIDEGERHIQLFDFDRAAVIHGFMYNPDRNDIKGVIFTLYEMITNDDSYREVNFPKQDPETVLRLEQWPQKRELDADIECYRKHIAEWTAQRSKNDQTLHGPKFEMPEIPPPRPVILEMDGQGNPVYGVDVVQTREEIVRFGQYMVDWRRAPQIV
ncbi:hypothetical protein MBLNU459_g6526t1 [Dothideomycetes sp. NU459]